MAWNFIDAREKGDWDLDNHPDYNGSNSLFLKTA